jgi:hypothetical protein
MSTIPHHTAPIWNDGKLMNRGNVPLWSGKGPVPEIGDIVPVGKGLTVLVEDYKVDHGWLMLVGVRSDGVRGDLAGTEIAWKLMPPAGV